MSITEGKKLNEIRKNDVDVVSFTEEKNFIFRYKGDATWYFVFDNDRKKISKQKIDESLEFAKISKAGNEEILTYLIAQIKRK
jgi:hypothetical protein